jgi:mannosyl-oligosaccharide alpha-1,3-glucosidase
VLLNRALEGKQFSLAITAFQDGYVHVLIDEPGADRYRVKDYVRLDAPRVDWVVDGRGALGNSGSIVATARNVTVNIQLNPLVIKLDIADQPAIVLNSRGMLNVEHKRQKESVSV